MGLLIKAPAILETWPVMQEKLSRLLIKDPAKVGKRRFDASQNKFKYSPVVFASTKLKFN